MAKVGVLTIGQSPRMDVTPSIEKILGNHIDIVERGGLDRITEEDIHRISPDPNETTYVSRLRNGNSVKIGKEKLLPLLQSELYALEKEVDVILMLCTGDFPTLKTTKPIIYPDKVLFHTVQAIQTQGRLGLIIPLPEQKKSLSDKWRGLGLDIEIGVASPYESSDIVLEAAKLKDKNANIIVLDCMGYNEEHKKQAQQGSSLPVILPRTLIARIAKEYVNETSE